MPPQLSGIVCTYHPDALGLSPKHTIFYHLQFLRYIYHVKRTKINKKNPDLAHLKNIFKNKQISISFQAWAITSSPIRAQTGGWNPKIHLTILKNQKTGSLKWRPLLKQLPTARLSSLLRARLGQRHSFVLNASVTPRGAVILSSISSLTSGRKFRFVAAWCFTSTSTAGVMNKF